MGVFGMLAVAMAVFAMRQVLTDEQWVKPEKFLRVSFWGLNIGLGLMVILNLFLGGVVQLRGVLNNGYWQARTSDFMDSMRFIEWLRLPADLIFIVCGVLPLLLASLFTWRSIIKSPQVQKEIV
jgi:nitric oxide reductase subunit B